MPRSGKVIVFGVDIPVKLAFYALTEHGIDHSLGVVGYGTDSEHGDYWIIRNSWGHKWADHGYVYLPRGFDGGEGWNGYCGHFMASGAHVYTMGDPRYYYEV